LLLLCGPGRRRLAFFFRTHTKKKAHGTEIKITRAFFRTSYIIFEQQQSSKQDFDSGEWRLGIVVR
jgi:hypothetical protein